MFQEPLRQVPDKPPEETGIERAGTRTQKTGARRGLPFDGIVDIQERYTLRSLRKYESAPWATDRVDHAFLDQALKNLGKMCLRGTCHHCYLVNAHSSAV